MPYLNLGNLAGIALDNSPYPSGAIGEAGFRLLSYMAWPADEARRNQFMALQGARALAHLETTRPEDLGICVVQGVSWEALRKESLEKVKQRHLDPYGGIQSAIDPGADRLNQEASDGLNACLAVGKILDTARRIAEFHPEARGGASINKAVAILDAVASHSGKRTALMDAWSSHKTVAHLGAAFAAAMALARAESAEFRKIMLDGLWYREGIGVTLALALNHQQWGREYIPHGQKSPLLPDDLWLVPEGLKLPTAKPPMGRLPAELSAVLEKYRAPKAYY
jgi:hypothetical protein